ncbi:GATA transcription factor 12 [Hibiscus syriacus]|uniref:GATA transcription factor n=1 Tax=Hibiscus syriacus TaxID=106335 RepID=A0A6A3C148_HIBSY|nr:GATA transcription factor 12 [Hibiscus syriacus]
MDAPEFFQASSCSSQLAPEKPASIADHFIVEDLLHFSNEDAVITEQTFDSSAAGHSTDSYTVTVVDSCNSSSFSGCELILVGGIACRGFTDGHSSAHFMCRANWLKCDNLTELEWLSNFVEESFSSDNQQKQQLLSGMNIRPDDALQTLGFHTVVPTQINDTIDNGENNHGNNTDNPIFNRDMSVPAKARSKRSRAAPCNWASRLILLGSSPSYSEPDIVVPLQMPPSNQPGKKPVKTTSSKKKDGGVAISDERKCLHCATDKTPQWRTGPMGPKTLCNACGVRYKSGRLVPDYRPASSPTFVLTKHSNSHRKVLELRRQKEMLRSQQQHQ